jgi:hypothetical protein
VENEFHLNLNLNSNSNSSSSSIVLQSAHLEMALIKNDLDQHQQARDGNNRIEHHHHRD